GLARPHRRLHSDEGAVLNALEVHANSAVATFKRHTADPGRLLRMRDTPFAARLVGQRHLVQRDAGNPVHVDGRPVLVLEVAVVGVVVEVGRALTGVEALDVLAGTVTEYCLTCASNCD